MTQGPNATYHCPVCGATWSYEAVRHLACCRDCGSGLVRTLPTLDRGGAVDQVKRDGGSANPMGPLISGRAPQRRSGLARAAVVAVPARGSGSNLLARARRRLAVQVVSRSSHPPSAVLARM